MTFNGTWDHIGSAKLGPFSSRDNLNPPRVNILGVGVSAIDMQMALKLSDDLIERNGRGYVCVTGVHGISEAQSDPDFRKVLNASFLTVPDGMPTVWVGRLLRFKKMRRVYGPDYMMELCELSRSKGYRHFLYGGKPGVAQKLAADLSDKFPGIQITGTYTPPFRPLSTSEEQDLFARLNAARPHIIWVGLSTPKQERFMAQYIDQLPANLAVGVGAAFDIHSGGVADAPDWMKSLSLQWVHRLFQEPRRLWKRYLLNNPRFLWCILLQISGLRRYKVDPEFKSKTSRE